MKWNRYIITIAALQILGLSFGFANTEVEDLRTKLTKATEDKERVAILNDLAWEYLYFGLRTGKENF